MDLCHQLIGRTNARALHGKFCHELHDNCSDVYIKNGRIYRFCLHPLPGNGSTACRGGPSFECDEHMRRREVHLEHSIWKPGGTDEKRFWDSWLSRGLHLRKGHAFVDDFYQRLNANRTFLFHSLLLRARRQRQISVLDVGAGPLTGFGHKLRTPRTHNHPAASLHVTAVDPLGKTYDELLRKHGVAPPVRTQTVMGERLEHAFGHNKFDLAFSVNALDHSMDPLRVLRQMIRVVKPGRNVYVQTYANEAHMGHYRGFHKWNFGYVCEAGNAQDCRYTLWARGRSQIDVGSELSQELDFVRCNRDAAVAHRLDYRADARMWNKTTSICCVLRKRGGGADIITADSEPVTTPSDVEGRLAACNCVAGRGHKGPPARRQLRCPFWSEVPMSRHGKEQRGTARCSGFLPHWSVIRNDHSQPRWPLPVSQCSVPVRMRRLKWPPPPSSPLMATLGPPSLPSPPHFPVVVFSTAHTTTSFIGSLALVLAGMAIGIILTSGRLHYLHGYLLPLEFCEPSSDRQLRQMQLRPIEP